MTTRLAAGLWSVLVGCALQQAGCESDPSPAPRKTNPSASSPKSEIFSSFLAVPTREGELARRELAMAGEIERLWSGDPRIESIRTSVRLSPHQTNPDSATGTAEVAIVAAVASAHDDPTSNSELEQALRATAQSVTGSDRTQIVLAHTSPNDTQGPQNDRQGVLSGALLFAAGACVGIGVERWLASRRRNRSR
jgi:hypothetical protein